MVDETQISKPQEYADIFKQNLTCIFISVRGTLKETFQCVTPCTVLTMLKYVPAALNVLQPLYSGHTNIEVINALRHCTGQQRVKCHLTTKSDGSCQKSAKMPPKK